MRTTDILRGELERLYELDELQALSRDVLGFEPDEVGGTAARGTFAAALTKHCLEHNALEALCDALLATRAQVDPRVVEIRSAGTEPERLLSSGDQVGPFRIVRALGEGRVGVAYLARIGEANFRLKVLRPQATRDQRGLHRYLTQNRLMTTMEHPGLPRKVRVMRFSDTYVVAHELVEGQTLASRMAWAGPLHFDEGRALLAAILQPLKALHERRLAHGDLHLENIIVNRADPADPKVVLLDAGCDRLRVPSKLINGSTELFSTSASPASVAPEQIQGLSAETTSDVYSFGAMLYQLMCGRPVFSGTAFESALGHLSVPPPPLSRLAPPGWVTPDVDEFALRCLAKNPADRPTGAGQLLELLETMARRDSRKRHVDVEENVLASSIEAVLQDPLNEKLVSELERLVKAGADAARVAEAFTMASEILDGPGATATMQAGLLLRAARLYEAKQETLSAAERAYEAALRLLPNDELALTGLEEVRKRAGKYEELIEMLLQKNEQTQASEERAQTLSEIGRIYAQELDDSEQALVAFTQAFAEAPLAMAHAIRLEQQAGADEKVWESVLASLAEAAAEGTKVAPKNAIYLQMARWYQTKLQRFDLARSCLNSILDSTPGDDAALAGLTELYRRSQQWRELGATLSRRAEAAPAPLARDLRVEAAELLEQQLNDQGGARDLYQRVLDNDPAHARAAEGLSRIYEQGKEFASLATLLRQLCETLRGEERSRVSCRLADVLATHLDQTDEAVRVYKSVLAENPNHLEALRSIDRVLSQAERHDELLEVLTRELELAATPRQKIALLRRIATIYDEEFLDHERAASALQSILDLDPADQDATVSLMRHCRALERWEQLSSLYERLLRLNTDAQRRVELALNWGRLLGDQMSSPEKAMSAYELVLKVDPRHEVALDAVARLKENAGDSEAAIKAILMLADKARTPYEKSQQLLRAGNLWKAAGNSARAIDCYKQAIDADPDDADLRARLREAYIARKDFAAAFQLLDREIHETDGERAKAKLASEMARLARDGLGDDERAEAAAKRALAFDPTDLVGLTVMGDLAFEGKRFVEASKHYESMVGRADTLPRDEATRVLLRHIESLARSKKLDKAASATQTLLELFPDDPMLLERVAHITLEYGEVSRAIGLYERLLEEFDTNLPAQLEAQCHYRYGDALRQSGETHAALAHLERAYQVDSTLDQALTAQALVHEKLENWQQVARIKALHLETAEGEECLSLLLELGDLNHDHLEDRKKAAEYYSLALAAKPDDRRVLTRLMQLYSQEEAWDKLLEVVLKLESFVEVPEQKAKYLETAAAVTFQQLGDTEQALAYYKRAFELKPSLKALDEAIEIHQSRDDHPAVERLLRKRVEVAKEAGDSAQMLSTFIQLAELYERKLGDIDNAIDAYEAAHTLDPSSQTRAELLSELYASDAQRFIDRGVKLHAGLLKQTPQRADSYRALRRLYTEVGDIDACWCLCQTLTTLKLADPDETRFFARHRTDSAAAVKNALTDEDWLNSVLHPLTDPLLTSVFALIEPAVVETRAEALEEFGYGEEHRIELASHYSLISRSVHHAAGALGVPLPPAYENTNDPGGLSFLNTVEPSIVFGNAALNAEVPTQAAAFISARHLAYFRPGLYLRQLIGTGTGLKSWLFAAIKLTAPQFPVAPEMEGPISEAIEALKGSLQAQVRDHLTRVVAKILQTGAALDLKRWIAGVDLTADRAGFLLANDLDTAAEILEVSEETACAVGPDERYKELVLFSVSPEYLKLRRKLGITVQN